MVKFVLFKLSLQSPFCSSKDRHVCRRKLFLFLCLAKEFSKVVFSAFVFKDGRCVVFLEVVIGTLARAYVVIPMCIGDEGLFFRWSEVQPEF